MRDRRFSEKIFRFWFSILHYFVPTPPKGALWLGCRIGSSLTPTVGMNPLSQPTKNTMSTAKFYHAGCPVCVEAEQKVATAIDPAKYNVEIIHLGEAKDRVAEAEGEGVKSVPALVLDGVAFHINFGADISALK